MKFESPGCSPSQFVVEAPAVGAQCRPRFPGWEQTGSCPSYMPNQHVPTGMSQANITKIWNDLRTMWSICREAFNRTDRAGAYTDR